MTRLVAVCSSIEGEAIKIKTRQWYEGLPKSMPGGKKKRSFKLGINSIAIIEKEYSNNNDVLYVTSNTSKGDMLVADSIDGEYYSNKILKPRKTKGSGEHSASVRNVNGGVYAHIEVSKREITESKEIEARNPQVKPLKNEKTTAERKTKV
jgi:hypothetical protein